MLECTTTRPGTPCAFMTPKGCKFNGGSCHPAIEECQGCARTVIVGEMMFCTAFPDPAAKWRYGKCNFATHVKDEAPRQKVNLNPLKASKRAAARR